MRHEPQHRNSGNCFVGVYKLTHNQQLFAAQNIYIAYSGGMDSHVLLYFCAANERLKNKITAVYVNHDLQAEAESWGLHCQQVCSDLGVNYLSLNVNAHAACGESPEEAARNARYAVLKPLLDSDDVLLVAQHADDQLETVFLQLFRGSGLKGLSGMPPSMPFGKGKLLRPLLDVNKAGIIDYAQQHGLKWIEDPSNQHNHFDRNFLRNDIIPLLKQRWPSLEKTVSRSATHCSNAQTLIGTLGDSLFKAAVYPYDSTLCLDELKAYSMFEQQLVIREWFSSLGLKMPSSDLAQKIIEEVILAKPNANPVLLAQHHQIRRYRNKLYCIKTEDINTDKTLIWSTDENTLRISADRTYKTVASTAGIPINKWLNASITVKFRSGGETIQLPNREGHHSLKKLYQEVGIPPWERAIIPLIYLDNQLAAVGEHWLSADFYSTQVEPCVRILCCKKNPKDNDVSGDVV